MPIKILYGLFFTEPYGKDPVDEVRHSGEDGGLLVLVAPACRPVTDDAVNSPDSTDQAAQWTSRVALEVVRESFQVQCDERSSSRVFTDESKQKHRCCWWKLSLLWRTRHLICASTVKVNEWGNWPLKETYWVLCRDCCTGITCRVSSPGSQKWLHHLLHKSCSRERCCPTSRTESRQSAPPQGWQPPARYPAQWRSMHLQTINTTTCAWVREEEQIVFTRALQRTLTVHDSPASQVTLKPVGQRLVRCGKVANGDKAVVIHRLSQLDDGNVISAQNGEVRRRIAERRRTRARWPYPKPSSPFQLGWTVMRSTGMYCSLPSFSKRLYSPTTTRYVLAWLTRENERPTINAKGFFCNVCTQKKQHFYQTAIMIEMSIF